MVGEEEEGRRRRQQERGFYGPAALTAMARWLECRSDAFDGLVVDDIGGRCVWAQGLLAITVVHDAS